jgi:hypothetical protein
MGAGETSPPCKGEDMPHWRDDVTLNRRVEAVCGTVSAVSGTTATQIASLGTLPAGAVIFAALIQVKTAFNAASTNVVTVGHSATTNAYVAAADVTEATPGAYVTYLQTTLAAETTVNAYYTCTGTAPTTGSADVTLLYSL